MFYRIGTKLSIKGMEGTVIGYIQYKNTQDADNVWTEYRLRTQGGERWLSCDEQYDEYSVSWPANSVNGQIGPEWHKVDEGIQVVVTCGGDVDVDRGESAAFIEYEDAEEERTLSVEAWSDGSEFSYGYYVEKSEIQEVGFSAIAGGGGPSKGRVQGLAKLMIFGVTIFTVMSMFSGISGGSSRATIKNYLKKSGRYTYETSITGNAKQSADVYEYFTTGTTDEVALDIIDGVKGNTQSVTQKDDASNEEIAILTKSEYCLIYHPEDDPNAVLVQISNRKYNYTSDHAPHRSSASSASWYRSHYYSSGYSADSSSFRSTPSAYSMYNGTTVHNIGNGYFDSYSSSIRQSSVNTRSSSGGGLSSGK